jgi:hypothetical protein
LSNWYEIKVTPEHKKDYVSGGRVLIVYDERPKAKIIQAMNDEGSAILWRGAWRHDQTTLETRGTIAILKGHLISIEDRIDLNERFPMGPTDRSPY